MSGSMSGVAIHEDCHTKFKEMQQKHMLRYVLYKIENKKTIVVDTSADTAASYDDFLKALPQNEPRYCAVDVDYTTSSGAQHSKIVFIFWCPDDCAVKDRMIYAASKDTIKKALNGVQVEIQANDNGDIAKDDVQNKLK